MRTDYDVIIVGASISGSTCAKILNENNINTLVLEKRAIPRYKACGGLLSKKSLEYINKIFGPIPDFLYCENKDIEVFVSKDVKRFLSTRALLNKTFRNKLEKWICDESNANIKNAYYIAHIKKNDKIKVSYLDKNTQELNTVCCKYLIGADGGGSKVRENIDPNASKKEKIYSIQKIYKGEMNIDKSHYNFVVNKEYSDFFSWFNWENENIYIGTTFKLESKKSNYLEKFSNKIKENFDLKIIEYIRQEICQMDIRKIDRYYFGENNILLIGEASGLIYAFGEGIPSALVSAEISANCIIEALKNSKNAFELYNNRIQEEKNFAMNTGL